MLTIKSIFVKNGQVKLTYYYIDDNCQRIKVVAIKYEKLDRIIGFQQTLTRKLIHHLQSQHYYYDDSIHISDQITYVVQAFIQINFIQSFIMQLKSCVATPLCKC